jgi:hypothetical protein
VHHLAISPSGDAVISVHVAEDVTRLLVVSADGELRFAHDLRATLSAHMIDIVWDKQGRPYAMFDARGTVSVPGVKPVTANYNSSYIVSYEPDFSSARWLVHAGWFIGGAMLATKDGLLVTGTHGKAVIVQGKVMLPKARSHSRAVAMRLSPSSGKLEWIKAYEVPAGTFYMPSTVMRFEAMVLMYGSDLIGFDEYTGELLAHDPNTKAVAIIEDRYDRDAPRDHFFFVEEQVDEPRSVHRRYNDTGGPLMHRGAPQHIKMFNRHNERVTAHRVTKPHRAHLPLQKTVLTSEGFVSVTELFDLGAHRPRGISSLGISSLLIPRQAPKHIDLSLRDLGLGAPVCTEPRMPDLELRSAVWSCLALEERDPARLNFELRSDGVLKLADQSQALVHAPDCYARALSQLTVCPDPARTLHLSIYPKTPPSRPPQPADTSSP